MSGMARRKAGRDTRTPRGGAAWLPAAARPLSEEPPLDQLLAEPIVRLLMRRDRTDEATIRRLLQGTGSARPVLQTKNDAPTDGPSPILWLLHETARLWCGCYDREVRARLSGMTRTPCTVLVHLARHEGLNQAALAQILDITP